MTIADPSILRLAAVVESSDDAIITQACDGTIETWNAAAERLFGYSAVEAVGRHVSLIIPDDQRAADAAMTERACSREAVAHYRTTALTRAGGRLPVSVGISPIVTPEGELIGLARIVRDMSAHAVLEAEALRLAALADSSDDAILSTDMDRLVRTWNKAAERMFGYTTAEMIGQPLRRIVPDDRRGEEDRLLAAVRAGSVEHLETMRQRRDASLVAVSLTVSPIKTPHGEIIGISTIVRDVSQQRRLEGQALRLAAIVDFAEDAIVAKDLNGIVQSWNTAAERMFGYRAEEIVGRSIAMIIPEERLAEEDNVLRRIRAGRSIEHFETVRQRKDGSRVEISLSVSPIKTADGRVIGASKIARDITEQRRLARDAEEANRVKDEFLAMLSHELRTPLNAVLGYTRMLRTGQLAGDGRQQRAIEVIDRNAQMLSQLVSDVLDVSSIVTGKIRMRMAPCDLGYAASAAVDIVRPAAEAKGVELRFHNPEPALPAQCDVDRIQQVFWNLLSNAVKFTPRGGRVDISLGRRDGHAEIVVRDTGIGIKAESLPYVFQRFWQGETGPTRQATGLGLGLSLALHFVELHGGTIAAASEGDGRGATFTVTLPLPAASGS